MSSCLFSIGAEVLSWGLNDLLINKKTVAFSRPSHCPAISHIAFADDMIIFTIGSKQSLQLLMNFLSQYESDSGQLISKEKSCFVVGNNATNDRCQIIAEVTGYMRKTLPIKYLGCVLYSGRKKIDYFTSVLQKFEKKLVGWKSKLLSPGGRIILIMHILQSLPIYMLVATDPPKAILNRIDSICN